MQPKTVAILETRTGEHLADLVAQRGGKPLLAPALEEVPDIDTAEVSALLAEWRQRPFDSVIFQTGVGTRALFGAIETLNAAAEWHRLLQVARVVVRGPKPTAELNGRGVRIDVRAATPFTTETVLEALAAVDMRGSKVLVQRHGAANAPLCQALRDRGAAVRELACYKWGLPTDLGPLQGLLSSLAVGSVDAAVFTSAVQVHNLFAVADQTGQRDALRQALQGIVIASIGPVCSKTLMQYGISPSFEASPPKLGPLLTALDGALS